MEYNELIRAQRQAEMDRPALVRIYNYSVYGVVQNCLIVGSAWVMRRYVWSAGYSVEHLKWSLGYSCLAQAVSCVGTEIMVASGADQESVQTFDSVVSWAFILRGAMIWKSGLQELSYLRTLALPLYEGASAGLGVAVLYGCNAAMDNALTPLLWWCQNGVQAWLAEERQPNVDYVLPLDEEGLRAAAPPIDLSPPLLNGDEIDYIEQRSERQVFPREWETAASEYWRAVVNDAQVEGAGTINETVCRRTANMAESPRLRGLFVRLMDVISGLPRNERTAPILGMYAAVDAGGCQTAWATTFERIYRNLISDGQSLEWRVQERNSEEKERVVMNFLRFDSAYDHQHYLTRWRRAFGRETGMVNPLALESEDLYGRGLSEQVERAAQAMRPDSREWLWAFRRRYTPEMMIDRFRRELNDRERPRMNQEACDFLLERVGLTGAFLEDEANGLTVMDEETLAVTFTDKGTAWFLAAAGQLEPPQELLNAAPEFFQRRDASQRARQAAREAAE